MYYIQQETLELEYTVDALVEQITVKSKAFGLRIQQTAVIP